MPPIQGARSGKIGVPGQSCDEWDRNAPRGAPLPPHLTITHKYHARTARFQPSVKSASRFQPLHKVIVPGGPSLFRAR